MLFVNYEYPPLGGGGGMSMRELAVELARRHEVMVLTSGTPELATRERLDGVEIVRVPVPGRGSHSVASLSSMAGFMWGGRKLGLRVAREFRPDVINTWFALPSGPVGDYLARKLRVPHLLDLHGGDVYDPSKWMSPHRWPCLRRYVGRLIRRADRVAAVSSELRDRAGQYCGADTQSILVLPHGQRAPEVTPLSREALGLPEGAFIIASVGRLIARKAYHRLIEALALLGDDRAHLLLIGEGPLREELQALAARLGVAERVHLAGWVTDERKFQLLMASDVFALSSLHEAFGVVYVEAMYSGLPVVSTIEGGQRDFLRHETNALVLNEAEPARFAAAWRRLLDDEDLRRRLAAGARETAAELSIARMAQRYEAVFEEMAARS
ncbi:MAG: glycosyltransferase family 4 protein [Armatimonadia bacterium]